MPQFGDLSPIEPGLYGHIAPMLYYGDKLSHDSSTEDLNVYDIKPG